MSTEKNTKERILAAANELFAANGFASSSMREIATKADVNLAAINYHFKNKENLYWKVFDYNHSVLEKGIEEIGERTGSTEELTLEVFRFFMSDKAALMNTFKIFLSDNVELPEGGLALDQDEKFGPPGQEAFLEKINNEVPNSSELGKNWAMKMTFSLLVHFGVIMNTTVMQIKCKENDDLKPEVIEASLIQSVKAHLEHLRKNPNLFD